MTPQDVAAIALIARHLTAGMVTLVVAAQAVPEIPLPGWLQWVLGPMGLLILLLLIGVSGAKKDPAWVFGREYVAMNAKHESDKADLREEITYWRTQTERATNLGFQLLEDRSRSRPQGEAR